MNNVGAWVESEPVEVGAAVTKYYSFNGQRVAMRQGDEVYYLNGDHPSTSLRTGLGSTSLTTDDAGAVVSEVRYLPYGQERWTNGVSVTDFGFTSQRNEASFGLMDYNARYYSPLLGRFVSPDSIVPDPTSSGGFNRYRYTRNNPLRYSDPSGHFECAEVSGCAPTDYQRYRNTVPSFKQQKEIMENINSVNQVAITVWTVPVTGAAAPQILGPMLGAGTLGEAGYTGSFFIENVGNGELSLEGWNIGDGAAAFLSGELSAGLIPGSSNAVSFIQGATQSFTKGALQNGGGYALGRVFNGELPDLGVTALNSLSGGLSSNLGDFFNISLNKFLPSSNTGAAAAEFVSPIFSSSAVVGTQNNIMNNISEIVDSFDDGKPERCESVGGTAVGC